jgi:hypothetical protein
MGVTSVRLALFAAAACVFISQPVFSKDKPLLHASTEVETPGALRPSKGLAAVVLRAIDKIDIEDLDECLVQERFKKADYAALLRAVKIDAEDGRKLWFVRPALKPYCQALYGAHLFRYFLVEDQPAAEPRYRLLYHRGGDGFSVYPGKSHGLNDIEATRCIVGECRSTRMAFDGKTYRKVRCSITTFNNGDDMTKERRCGSDEGMDEQSSGFVRPAGR